MFGIPVCYVREPYVCWQPQIVNRQQGLAITGAKLIIMQREGGRLRRIPDGAHNAAQGNVIDSNLLPGLILQALRS